MLMLCGQWHSCNLLNLKLMQIQKRIDAQKEENALLTRLRELERQVEMNKLRESIAKLEAQAAATAPPEAAKPSPAAKPAPVSAPTKRTVREVAPASAGRKSTSAAQETSPAKRKVCYLSIRFKIAR